VPEFVLDDFLPYQLAVLSTATSNGFSNSYRDKFGISVPEWRVVAHLSQVEKISIREVYKQVEMDKSKASRATARLVEAGYVSKKINKKDRRLVELSLTPKGRDMVDIIAPIGQAYQEHCLGALSDEDRAIFVRSLKILMESCK